MKTFTDLIFILLILIALLFFGCDHQERAHEILEAEGFSNLRVETKIGAVCPARIKSLWAVSFQGNRGNWKNIRGVLCCDSQVRESCFLSMTGYFDAQPPLTKHESHSYWVPPPAEVAPSPLYWSVPEYNPYIFSDPYCNPAISSCSL